MPYPKTAELFLQSTDAVPGQPLIQQNDEQQVLEFLHNELSTIRLESMSWALFLVSKRRNISPLHHQSIKGRQILITERPDLHLVWHYNRIFIKPIPLCLLSYGFFEKFLHPRTEKLHALRKEANGFLKTYASLILHESDLHVAKTIGLVPSTINWTSWCYFIDKIRHLSSTEVSPRYQYGELRLTRLNFYHRVTSFGTSYLEVHHQYLSFFSIFVAPYLFIFGAIAVILGALQIALAANTGSSLRATAEGFCYFSITLSILGLLFFPALYLAFQLKELVMFIFYYQRKV